AMLDQYGVSKASGDARDAGGVVINGVDADKKPVSTIDAKKWYTTVGGRAGVTEQYVYSASVVRLREASIGYSLPASVLKSSFVKNLKLSLIGRNLAYFHKKAPYDPEVTMSTGNGLSGVDVFSLPAVRSFGLNLNVTF
ncbi:MAG TPA: SusC/RagA family TonB-linked outer membrane protein, partial [Chitinophaga sp.]